MTTIKTYIGDGVYAEQSIEEGLILTTENGIRTTNRIVLGFPEIVELCKFINVAPLPPRVDAGLLSIMVPHDD